MINGGFIKYQRSENSREILKRPKAFALLAPIAHRAKRTGELCVHGLKTGEALIGDRSSVGLTSQEYRTAKKFLEKYGLVTFRVTNRGTIAMLVDKSIFDINLSTGNRLSDTQATSRQQPSNKRITTKKNDKKNNNDKNVKNLKEYGNFKRTFLKNSTMPQPSYEEILRYR